jgi:hypothetical protein
VLEPIERIGHVVPSAKTHDPCLHGADDERSRRISARLESESSDTSNHVVDLAHVEEKIERVRPGRLGTLGQTTGLLVRDVLS